MNGGEDRGQPVSTNAITDADATASPVAGTDYRKYLEDDQDEDAYGDFDLRGDWEALLGPYGWVFDCVDGRETVWLLPGQDADDHWARTCEGHIEIGDAPPPFGGYRYLSKLQAYTLLNYGRLDIAAFRAATQALRLLGYAEDDLSAAREMVRTVRYQTPTAVQHSEPANAVDTWSAVDLGPYLDGMVPHAEPSVGLARDDGLRLLYPGKEHAVIGEMEAGKSWLCLASAAAEMNAGHIVVYAHFEERDAGDTTERLLALGVSAEAIRRLFRFVGPDRPLAGARDLAELLDPAPTLAVFDGVNEGMSLHDHGIRDEDGAAAFRRLLVKPFTKVGAATLSADHVVKDPEHRGRYALGSVHKANALSGSLLLIENVEPFGRGARGRSRISLVKDRPGYLRRHGQPGKGAKTYLGDLTVDATGPVPGAVALTFAAVRTTGSEGEQLDPDQVRRAEVDAHVIGVVAAITDRGDQATVTKIRSDSKVGSDATVDALDRLAIDGRLTETVGPRNARIFTVTQPGDVFAEAAPEPSRPNLVTRPSKGRGNQVGSNDQTSGRVRSGQVGSASEPNNNVNGVGKSNANGCAPSASLTAAHPLPAPSGIPAITQRSPIR